MSSTERIAWPFSFMRTLLIAAFDIAVLAAIAVVIAYSASPV
ncbi:MAG: hypothetical protein WDM89_07345 [Rhizomicrobium sp.]